MRNLLDFFRPNRDLTPEMRVALRKIGKDKDKANRLLVELHQQTELLSKKDIGLWRAAWQQALNIDNPKRVALYNIYTDVDIDLHLTGCIGQRKGMATKGKFKLVDKTGEEDERVTEIFQSDWFDTFVDLVLDTRYYGHSLIQFGAPVTGIDGITRFDEVVLVPRRHVIPEYGVVVRDINDTHEAGINYREGDFADWCIEVGKPRDLGLLLKCSPSALSKKNMLAFWDGFGEIFGMPIRIAHTTSTDKAERSKIGQMLEKMGAAFYGVFQEGTDIEIKESTRGDAYNVYDKRIDRANGEISKGILNQTMTIDSGSSLSQSETHLEVFQNVVDKDKQMVANAVNDKLLPFMLKHGFPVDGFRFQWDDTIEYSPKEICDIESMLINGGYDIEPKYFIDKYGIPVTGKSALPGEMMKRLTSGDTDFFA